MVYYNFRCHARQRTVDIVPSSRVLSRSNVMKCMMKCRSAAGPGPAGLNVFFGPFPHRPPPGRMFVVKAKNADGGTAARMKLGYGDARRVAPESSVRPDPSISGVEVENACPDAKTMLPQKEAIAPCQIEIREAAPQYT